MKKIEKKKIIIPLLLAIVVLGAIYGIRKQQVLAQEATGVDIVITKDQDIMYASVYRIYGNELTLAVEDQILEPMYIPVGTKVITKLGTETTFSRLASGDNLALITEKAGEDTTIVEVYIVD